MNLLFDIINHISGYTDKYYNELEDKINHEQLVSKYRRERDLFKDKIDESDLLGDKHPHCLLVLEGIQELYHMKGCDDLALNYLDSLIKIECNFKVDKYYRTGLICGTETTSQ